MVWPIHITQFIFNPHSMSWMEMSSRAKRGDLPDALGRLPRPVGLAMTDEFCQLKLDSLSSSPSILLRQTSPSISNFQPSFNIHWGLVALGAGALVLAIAAPTLIPLAARFVISTARVWAPVVSRTSRVWSPLVFLAAAACGEDSLGRVGDKENTDERTAPPPVENPSHNPSKEILTQSPCGEGAYISDIDLDTRVKGLGLCSDFNQKIGLFSWDPLAKGVAQFIPGLAQSGEQVLRFSSGKIAVSTPELSGLTVIDPEQQMEEHWIFPRALPTLPSSTGRPVTTEVQLSYPKGLEEVEGHVGVATANFNFEHLDYVQGLIPLYSDLETQQYRVLRSSGYNPTDAGKIRKDGKTYLVIVCTGAFDSQQNLITESRLDLFDVSDTSTLEPARTYSLGTVGAGINGEVAVTPDGKRALLPTGDNSGHILDVDLQTGAVTHIPLPVIFQRRANDGKMLAFFSDLSISPSGRYFAAGNYNDGRVYVVDLQDRSLVSQLVVDENLGDTRAITQVLWVGDELRVAVGGNILRVF